MKCDKCGEPRVFLLINWAECECEQVEQKSAVDESLGVQWRTTKEGQPLKKLHVEHVSILDQWASKTLPRHKATTPGGEVLEFNRIPGTLADDLPEPKKTNFIRLDEGYNTIRLIPSAVAPPAFFKQHYLRAEDSGKSCLVTCTQKSPPCPICVKYEDPTPTSRDLRPYPRMAFPVLKDGEVGVLMAPKNLGTLLLDLAVESYVQDGSPIEIKKKRGSYVGFGYITTVYDTTPDPYDPYDLLEYRENLDEMGFPSRLVGPPSPDMLQRVESWLEAKYGL